MIGIGRLTGALGILALGAALALASDDAPALKAGGSIDNDAVWEGKVRVERTVRVKPGVRLTIKAGTEVLFDRDAALEAAGSLDAVGTPDRPVRFGSAQPSPARGDWAGIRIENGEPDAVRMIGCVVTHARSIDITSSEAEIVDSRIESGENGLVVLKQGPVTVRGNVIRDMAGHGIVAQLGATPVVDGNTIERCAGVGVFSSQGSAPVVRGNRVSQCEVGIRYESAAPPSERNSLRFNGVGLAVVNVAAPMPIRGNRFEGNKTGLSCEQFSSPLVTANAFDNNERGLFSVRSSSPSVTGNAFTGNGTALAAEYMSNPTVSGNLFLGNRLAIFLRMSSYARVNGNNLDNNDAQVKLDFMSHDWEVRTGMKPERGEIARNLAMAGKGRAIAGKGVEGIDPNASAGAVGTVDATGNWWGARDTAEMAAKGRGGNIGSLIDGRDLPTQRYEGYPGEYAQDTVDFDGWKSARIPGAGIPDGGR